MPAYHAVVWIDHSEAHIFHLYAESFEKHTIPAGNAHTRLHHKGGAVGAGRTPEDQAYYHKVAQSLIGIKEILIAGPASAKYELIKHIQKHDKQLLQAVAGIRSMDHPPDKEIVAFGRTYFKGYDRMTG